MPQNERRLLPNYEKAVIPEDKIFGYALNGEHPFGRDKAIAFERALGYTRENGDCLIADIRNHLPSSPVRERQGRFGRQFSFTMEVTGVNGKTARVKVCWQIDKGTDFPRLASVYVDEWGDSREN